MPRTIILKLGGSIITDKQGGRPLIRRKLVRRLAGVLHHTWARDSRLKLILLHGAGSFGHPLACRYKLDGAKLNARQLKGAGETIATMRELGTELARVLIRAGLPVIPFQTSAMVRENRPKLSFMSPDAPRLLREIVQKRGIPLLGGDVVFTHDGRTKIASADGLAELLAKYFPGATLAFASDVDGVYPHFPPRPSTKPIKIMSRKIMEHVLSSTRTNANVRDVTGAMVGKLRSLLEAKNRMAIIFNGTKPEQLSLLLKNKVIGTTIKL